jgi:hypothetical protein
MNITDIKIGELEGNRDIFPDKRGRIYIRFIEMEISRKEENDRIFTIIDNKFPGGRIGGRR